MNDLEIKFKKLFPDLNYEDFKHSNLWICLDQEIIYEDNQKETNNDTDIIFNDKPGPVG